TGGRLCPGDDWPSLRRRIALRNDDDAGNEDGLSLYSSGAIEYAIRCGADRALPGPVADADLDGFDLSARGGGSGALVARQSGGQRASTRRCDAGPILG